jgi:hypothetical protein
MFGKAYKEAATGATALMASGIQAFFLVTGTPSDHKISFWPKRTQMLLL